MASEATPTAARLDAQTQLPITPCLDTISHKTVVAVQSLSALIQCYVLYLGALKDHAASAVPEKHTKAMAKRLQSMDALVILLSIYVHSGLVTDAERCRARQIALSLSQGQETDAQ